MSDSEVLLLEPDVEAQAAVAKSLRALEFRPVVSGSLEDALARAEAERPAAVIADIQALVTRAGRTGVGKTRVWAEAMRASIDRLRSMPEAVQERRRLVIIITSDAEDVREHEAALWAGADFYLTGKAASSSQILRHYLVEVKRRENPEQALIEDAPEDGAAYEYVSPYAPAPRGFGQTSRRTSPRRAAQAPAVHPTDLFELPDELLRHPESGRWDAQRIAEFMGVPLTHFVPALGANALYSTVAKTPDSAMLQSRLAPFANVLAMLRHVYEGDRGRVRAWLDRPQSGLGDKKPRDVLLTPGGSRGVEQLVAGAWFGDPE